MKRLFGLLLGVIIMCVVTVPCLAQIPDYYKIVSLTKHVYDQLPVYSVKMNFTSKLTFGFQDSVIISMKVIFTYNKDLNAAVVRVEEFNQSIDVGFDLGMFPGCDDTIYADFTQEKSFCRGADGKVIEERINADDHLINSSLSLLADLPTNTTVELIDITGTPFWRIEGVSISEYENASLICFIEKESSYLREVNLRVVESIGYGMFESH